MSNRKCSEESVVICFACGGDGVTYTEKLTDYHRRESDITQHLCHKCLGSGLLKESVKVNYEPFKQPERWIGETR